MIGFAAVPSRILACVVCLLLFPALSPAATDPVPQILDWTTEPTTGTVQFLLRWHNEDVLEPSNPVSGTMMSQVFGVFQADYDTIGNFNVPSLAPDSFFDIPYAVPSPDLPPGPEEQVPGGGCPPDDHWDGNVDVTWTGAAFGRAGAHYGTLMVCPGGGASYIHLSPVSCTYGVTWQVTGGCPGFGVALVGEDYSPAPGTLPTGWSGWICVTADDTVAVGTACCAQVEFLCHSAPGSGQPGISATINLCATTCDWAVPPSDPVPQVADWVTDPGTGHVQFLLRWHNENLFTASNPVSGTMLSQPFGAFQADYDTIGAFNVPSLAPDSFFDIDYQVALGNLPPGPAEQLPGGGPASAPGALSPQADPCPPDDHWDGNVDVMWSGAAAGQINVHYGTLLVDPGAGASYIHMASMNCSQGVTWQVSGLCSGFQATLVNEDFTPAPASLGTGWSGWICVTADGAVPAGETCCPVMQFTCPSAPHSGQPPKAAAITLCAQTCAWAVSAVNPAPGPIGLALQAVPNPTGGSTTLLYRLPQAGTVHVEVFDAAGRLVRRLLEGPAEAGPGSVTWNGQGNRGEALPAGVYVARLSLNGRVTTRKVLLLP